jgi:hypothetical protein
MHHHLRNIVEPLETRIAPAAVLTFLDVDGDQVTIKTSKGTDAQLDAAVVRSAAELGFQIQEINLTDPIFAGTTLSVSGKRANESGNGFVNVGFVNAAGNDLGKVNIKGDLGRIVAGNNTDAKPGVASLTVHSIGALGEATQASEGASLESFITGPLGALSIKTNLIDAYLRVQTDGVALGNISKITIGGNVQGGENQNFGRIEAAGSIGPIIIGGSLTGGDGALSGSIDAGGRIAAITIKGNVVGGRTVQDTGIIEADQGIGKVAIGGDLIGGVFQNTGAINTPAAIGSVTIGGSVIGGVGVESGQVEGGTIGNVAIGKALTGAFGNDSGQIKSGGNLGRVTIGGAVTGGEGERSGGIFAGSSRAEKVGLIRIGGDLEGGSGEFSGAIVAGGAIEGISIGGSVRGGPADNTGLISGGAGAGTGFPSIGPVTIGGSLVGSSLDPLATEDLVNTAFITAPRMGSVTIRGDIQVGVDENPAASLVNNAAIRAEMNISSVNVGGSILGTPETRVLITGKSGSGGTQAKTDIAIGNVRVGGSVYYTDILAGYDWRSQDLVSSTSSGALNVDAQFGVLNVRGDWMGSNLAVGAKAGDDGFLGTQDDSRIVPGGSGPPINATLKAVIIGGQVLATPDPDDRYGFVAEEIKSFRVGSIKYALKPEFRNDVESTELVPRYFLTDDTRFHEVPVA